MSEVLNVAAHAETPPLVGSFSAAAWIRSSSRCFGIHCSLGLLVSKGDGQVIENLQVM